MTFDPSLNEVLLVGFSQQGSMETWIWKGGAWQQLHPAASPSNRRQAGLAGDPSAKQVVLFGGFGEGSGYLNDTWVWNGSTWSESPQASAPSPRVDAPMAFDATTGHIVLQGGGGPTSFLRDTWSWDGLRWSEVAVNQTQFHSALQAFECGSTACAVEAGQHVWQWQAENWAVPS
jgi:hypothetical protein